jgi:hypothetical protein
MEHSSLLVPFESYEENKVLKVGFYLLKFVRAGVNLIKLFSFVADYKAK